MGENQLSAVEAELYDRQIRLWGIESQEKLRAADVLLIGVRGLGSEIAKNVLLSGINSLTIQDAQVVTEEEVQKNFFIDNNSLRKKLADEVVPKLQALNPLVKISTNTEYLSDVPDTFYENFTIIVATNIRLCYLTSLDAICRKNKIKLIYGDVFGTFGFCVADLQSHTFYEDKIILSGKKRKQDESEKKVVQVQSTLNYGELKLVLPLPLNKERANEHLKKMKRPNRNFFLMMCAIEFRACYGRDPFVSRKEQDMEFLRKIVQQMAEVYDCQECNLGDEVLEMLFGHAAPVCAIVGGFMAQEVIKAVSHKEVPIHNIFLFDPVTYEGKEMTMIL